MTPHYWQSHLPETFKVLEEEVAWGTGLAFRGMTLSKNADGWLLVVKVTSVQRGALVAFYGAPTLEGAVSSFAYEVAHKQEPAWKEDKFAK